MAVFDKEYYTDMIYAENGIRFDVKGGIAVSHAVRPAKDQTYWQYIVPDAVHMTVTAAPGAVPSVAAESSGADRKAGVLARLMSLVRSTQKELTKRLNGFGTRLKDDPWGAPLWMFLALSFVYGVVHAVGPGHGKAVVCSWFLSRPGSLWRGALMGNAITFVHMGSAALAVGAAYLLFSSGMGGFAAASRAIQPAGYGLLALMGLFLLAKSLLDLRRGGLLTDHACAHAEPEGGVRSILAVSFVTGLIPCPGAAVILAFAIGLNIFWTGVAALLVMALGMGLTTTLFAWFAVSARTAALTLSGRNRRLFNTVHAGLSICGAAAIGLFGTALFIGSLTA
jgi:ABC-type nickel/cobalt efflux system permease component RcnA